jgi:hypothetical protein
MGDIDSGSTGRARQASPCRVTAKYDGKANPVFGDPSRDTVALKRAIIARMRRREPAKRQGRSVGTFTGVVSKDGTVLTITSKKHEEWKKVLQCGCLQAIVSLSTALP